MIVPASAGGTIDIITRTLAPGLSEGLGQAVVVENRATSSTTVAEEYVARATPDGHTMFMAGTSRATNPHLYTKLAYDPLRDLTSVTLSRPAATRWWRALRCRRRGAGTDRYRQVAAGQPLLRDGGVRLEQPSCSRDVQPARRNELIQVPYKGPRPRSPI